MRWKKIRYAKINFWKYAIALINNYTKIYKQNTDFAFKAEKRHGFLCSVQHCKN